MFDILLSFETQEQLDAFTATVLAGEIEGAKIVTDELLEEEIEEAAEWTEDEDLPVEPEVVEED